MIHVYYGDGKGKTTAAVGLAVRAAGQNLAVLFAQFLKSDSSGEVESLRSIDRIELLHATKQFGFVRDMTDEQKQETKKEINHMYDCIVFWLNQHPYGVVVLDEILHAHNYGFLSTEQCHTLLEQYASTAELVITGRNPDPMWLQKADYITEFKKHKHPYDQGIAARKGIEF